MPRTKGSRNGYTKYPGKYTPIGRRVEDYARENDWQRVGNLTRSVNEHYKKDDNVFYPLTAKTRDFVNHHPEDDWIRADAHTQQVKKLQAKDDKKKDYKKIFEEAIPYDDFEKNYNKAVESGRLSYDDLHPTSKVKYPDTNTHSFTDYHNTKGYKTGKKNDWQQKANKASSFGHNIYSKRKYIRNVTTHDSDRYVKKKEEALNARRRELRANTQKAAAASRLRNAHSDIGNALRDARDDLRSLFRRVSRKLKRKR